MKRLTSNFVAKINDSIQNKYCLSVYPVKHKSKFAIICPGGGYNFVCTAKEGLPIAMQLNRKGYTAFVLRYHTKHKGKYPIPQQDLARAIKHILDNAELYNVEKADYSIWGFSAGGHLAASFGTDNMGYKNYNLPKPALIVLGYPVISMGEYTHEESRLNLFGSNYLQFVDFGSIEKQVTPHYPPTYIWCCSGDNVVKDINSKMMINQLKDNNVNFVGKIFDNVSNGHGIALASGTNADGWLNQAVEFWEELTS